MKKNILFLLSTFLVIASYAQKNYFIYLQTDNKQTFSVKFNGKDLSSTVSGYMVIPKLSAGEHSFSVSFPKSEWPKQNFNVLVRDNDEGYMLKNFSEKGWGLYNLQSMDIVMNGDQVKKAKLLDEAAVEIVKTTPILTEEKKEPVKEVLKTIEEEKPVAKVATNIADRAPVEKAIEKVEEKKVEIIVEKPIEKVEEKVLEKVEPKQLEKVEQKTAEKVEEKPIEKVPLKIVEPETGKENIVENESITKVSTFNDEDGITTTYKIKTAYGSDIVPVFIERSRVEPQQETANKKEEKFIKNIELPNPNSKTEPAPILEKTEEPATAKVATNIADRAPVEKPTEKKIAEKPTEKIETEPAQIIEKKPVEKAIEKVEEKVPEKVAELPVKKVEEKVETNTTESNGLKITIAEKTTKDSKPIASYNSDCKELATEEDFFKTRKKMVAEDSDDAMITVALKLFKQKCYTVDQIKNLALIFLTDEGRYKLLDAAYPYTSDTNRYELLEPLFKEAYYIKRFKVMLDK